MHRRPFAIVDVETTGCVAPQDRVIEVGVVVMEEGRVVERFSSLVNPERPVSPFILRLTGIKGEDLQKAPTFAEIEGALHGLLKGRVFVAHNVRFDYGFLQSEFARLGREFMPDLLCTVRLSRALFPKEKRHGVDHLIERFGFSIASRHRALDDAEVLRQFLELVSKRFSQKRLGDMIDRLINAPESLKSRRSRFIQVLSKAYERALLRKRPALPR